MLLALAPCAAAAQSAAPDTMPALGESNPRDMQPGGQPGAQPGTQPGAQPATPPDSDAVRAQHDAAWAEAPFTCHDLLEATAGKDDSQDNSGNYEAILSWESDYSGVAEHRDLQNRRRLADDVLKMCTDLAASGRADARLAGVVEKAWRLGGE
jgi:hypothetical protein